MNPEQIGAGDHVLEKSSGEELLVMWVKPNGMLYWCGWPNGCAPVDGYTLIKKATDQQRQDMEMTAIKQGVV